MQDFERLGIFYIGRPYDLASKSLGAGWLLYDSSDLVTHAVCVGMTGSGKTGLCIGLLEEAAIDGIPALVIDPKGDLSNLMLTFPELRKEDFRPWINEDEARREGLSPDEYAARQAALWKKGLAEWGQDGGRIARLRQAADFDVYTPGSNAGLPISILSSLAAPPPAVIEDSETFKDQIGATVSGLLGLLGIGGDPLQSREHILLSNLIGSAWTAGRDLDLAALIQQIQAPPMKKVGVLDLESFYPAKERFALAMSINNLLASPGFEAWLQGEPLDVDRLLHGNDGKPRIAVFSIAHLSDAERMFFVTFLLNKTIGWMRSQPGTSSLRALLYMDEIFGFFPPVANPPSKQPMLTLLKQARAYGLGIVLATQNPVDLDYKGLSNAGTWFIGRLQTERDKARVLDGLQGAAAGVGVDFDRKEMEETLAGLGSRIFLMNNVREDEPVVFKTRWTMSYLRGPLTRDQIRALMASRQPAEPAAEAPAAPASAASGEPADSPGGERREGADGAARGEGPVAGAGGGAAAPADFSRPALHPSVPQFWLTPGPSAAGRDLVYRPVILGSAQLHYSDKKKGIDATLDVAYRAPVTDAAVPVSWDDAVEAGFRDSDLAKEPVREGAHEALPAAAAKAKSYEDWGKEFAAWLSRTQKLELLKSPLTEEISQAGESERDFRIRLQQAHREARDGLKKQLEKKYNPKISSLTDRVRRAGQAVAREEGQARQAKMQTVISFGATLLGSFLGRKRVSVGTIGRATTTARGVGRSVKEARDVGRAKENFEALQAQLKELETEFQAELQKAETTTDPLSEALETVELTASRRDISVRLVALVWSPHCRGASGELIPAR